MDYWNLAGTIVNNNFKGTMIRNSKIGILGAGISGISASKLALQMGYEVLLSEIDKQKKIDIEPHAFLRIELGGHSDLILNCDFVIISPGMNPNTQIVRELVSKGIPIISEIEFASWFTRSDILAVTGSNGKSTTVSMLHNIFVKSKFNSLLGGNIGTPFSKNILFEKNTKSLEKFIHIVELSSFQVERLERFFAKIGCILNISEDHLDRYESMDDYINAKLKLVNHSKFFFYDSIDEKLNSKLKNISNSKPISGNKYFYIKNNAVYQKESDEILFKLDETSLIGRHNLMNAFNAAIISRVYGLDNKTIRSGILDFKPLSHRLEKVNVESKINFYNDSKSTNIKSTLKALDSFEKNVILVLGGRDKGGDFTELISTLKSVKKVFCYGECGNFIYEILKTSIEVEYIENFKECILSSVKQAHDGDNILLSPACASFDQFENYEQRGNEFKNLLGNLYE